MIEKITNSIKKIAAKGKTTGKRAAKIFYRNPLKTFFGLLLLLFALIFAGNILRRPTQTDQVQEKQTKQVEVYRIGEVPTIQVQGRVEKTGVVTIVAQNGGVVRSINVNEGQIVNQYQNILSLSSSYNGGNIPSLQRQIAAQNYNNTVATYDLQKEIIGKQREAAQKTEENAQELRNITEASLAETRDIISLNETILNTLNSNLENLEEATSSAANDQLILSTRQLKSQYLSALSQLRSGLRSSEYQAGDENPPAELAEISKEITLKQLELQEKGLNLSKEIALLNLRVAQVSESLMFPSAPFQGTIERIYVRVGQSVAPGTPLALLACTNQSTEIVALVPKNTRDKLSRLEPSKIFIDANPLELFPTHIASEPTDGRLFAVVYPAPEGLGVNLTDKAPIIIEMPVGYADTGGSSPYIPIDAVFQTQEEDLVFVVEDGRAQSKVVVLGPVVGSFVEVLSGLEGEKEIILNRTVISGDPVQVL